MTTMKTRRYCLLLGPALLAGMNYAAAQGTAFTYQGRINDGGNPANGSYDFRFRLAYDALGSSYAGVPFQTNGVPVSNGQFVTAVDFGGIFTGSNYWLEVDVRTNGESGFTSLSPLQAITPTPYAIFANTASNLSGALPASQLTGAVGNGQLANSSVTVNAGAGLTGGGPVPLGGATTLNNSGVLSITGNADITASTSGGAVTLSDTATSANAANTLVKRDANGNLSAGTITANLLGNATTATTATSLAGSLPDGQLSGNVAMRAGGNIFAGAQVVNGPLSINTPATPENDFAINTSTYLFSNPLYLRGEAGIDHNHGLAYNGHNVTNFGGGVYQIDGPALWGWDGGVLGTRNGGDNGELVWGPDAVIVNVKSLLTAGLGVAGGSLLYGGLTVNDGGLTVSAGGLSVSGNSLLDGASIDPSGKNLGSVASDALVFGAALGSSGEGIASARGGVNDLEFYTDWGNRMTIGHNGNVGIGTTSPTETLEINGTSRLDDNDMFFRKGSDHNHGLGYRHNFGATVTDGPYLYGWGGGALGTTGGQSIALQWDDTGSVSVNNNLTINGALKVAGAGVNTPTTAFIHTTTHANLNESLWPGSSMIDNPVCNGNPNAMLIITELWGQNNFWGDPTAVSYANGYWWIVDRNLQGSLIEGLAFNVLVIVP